MWSIEMLTNFYYDNHFAIYRCFKSSQLKFSQCYYILYCCAKSLQSCLTLCDPMDCSLPGFTIHGILQARILEWVAMPSSRGSSPLRDGTQVSYVSYIGRQVLGKPMLYIALCQKRCFKKQVSEEEAELEKWTYPLRCCSEVGFYQVLGEYPSGSGN